MNAAAILLPSLFVLLANAATIAAFGADKRRAIRGEWRIRESTLLSLALIGGSPGALWARKRFRHKTRKQPFSTLLDLVAMLHAGLAMGCVAAFGL